ncbi:uncharacterized protein BP5553_05446 [Venustampulla echinocandica]|uniref:Secreted protein n=1 Tax=Venustampulla echinocandica TaxID=2656787 RepID=A0A370TR76_9HELO|nr:uncharacterized protein BP5553_05446 [Venustampulla echinocandica]RDL38013.1 hypothetical protein BP5553_05446 [Venustampulla echinocandica]
MKFTFGGLVVLLTATPIAADIISAIVTHSQANNRGCTDNADYYQIFSSINQIQGRPGCSGIDARLVAASQNKRGSQLEGCNWGYSGHWAVCMTSYGCNVHNGQGQHQRCVPDSTTVMSCPQAGGLYGCWTYQERVMKCSGVWEQG